MASVIFIMLLCIGFVSASTDRKSSSALFNITRGNLENILRPLERTLTRTGETFRGVLKSAADGRSDLNLFGNTGGRLPYNIRASAEEGGSLDFIGRIVSSIQPYLDPLRILATRTKGNATAMAWSTSEDS